MLQLCLLCIITLNQAFIAVLTHSEDPRYSSDDSLLQMNSSLLYLGSSESVLGPITEKLLCHFC